LGKTAVKELLQKDMTVEKVRAELVQLLEDVEYRNKIFEDYQRLKEFMGKPGCSQRAARKMAAFLE
jgi:lipid-A-disaccharide synthase